MRRILLVDDDGFSLTVLARLLRLDGYDVDALDDARQALVRLEQQTFDVVISDLQMPFVKGFALLDAACQHSPRALRILLTAHDAAWLAVPDGVIAMEKPLDYEALLRLLAERA